jgi:RNA-directed DNA polymerase
MRRRHDDLFGRIANFQALHAAARRAIKGKRKKPGAAAFFANLERELLALERQLHDSSYRDRHAHVLRCDIYRYFPAVEPRYPET